MKNAYRKYSSILSLIGTIPFIFYLFMAYKSSGVDNMCGCIKIEYLKAYSLAIISFISGYIWTYSHQKKSIKLAMIAVIGPLLIWANFIFNHSAYYFVVDIVYFIALLLVEGEKYDEHETAKWYYKMRIGVTTIVVLCLIGVTYL